MLKKLFEMIFFITFFFLQQKESFCFLENVIISHQITLKTTSKSNPLIHVATGNKSRVLSNCFKQTTFNYHHHAIVDFTSSSLSAKSSENIRRKKKNSKENNYRVNKKEDSP